MNRYVNINNIKSMLKKEFKQLFREPRLRFMIVAPPIFMLMIFGYAVNTDVKNAHLAVLDEDKSAMSREFIQCFTASPTFDYYASVDSSRYAVQLLDRGDIDFFLQIEQGFSRNIRKGIPAQVQVIIDGSDSSRASVIMSYINGVVSTYTQGLLKNKLQRAAMLNNTAARKLPGMVQLEQRIMFNQSLVSLNYFLPSIIGILITLITVMVPSMSIVREREAGTIEQINVSPMRPMEYILGKMIPFAIVAFVDICIITFLSIAWFHVPFRGSFLFLLFSGIIFILSTLSIGLYISTISSTQQQAMLSTFLFFIPAILLSGFIFPIYAMPKSMQLITYVNPLRYFIEITRSIFLKGVGITVLWKDVVSMLLIGIILLFMSVKRYHKRME